MRNCSYLVYNLTSADPRLGAEVYSRLLFINIIDLLDVSPIKGIKIYRKHILQFLFIDLVRRSFIRTNSSENREHYYTNRDLVIAPKQTFLRSGETGKRCLPNTLFPS